MSKKSVPKLQISIREIVVRLGQLACDEQFRVVTAESCTGGMISAAITELEGCSQWFDRGYVCYGNQAKQEMLAVNGLLIKEHGAVSEVVVRLMAQNALMYSGADFSVAVSGLAGPGVSNEEKAVGTVWFAWADMLGSEASCMCFDGDRALVRHQATFMALQGLLSRMQAKIRTR